MNAGTTPEMEVVVDILKASPSRYCVNTPNCSMSKDCGMLVPCPFGMWLADLPRNVPSPHVLPCWICSF